MEKQYFGTVVASKGNLLMLLDTESNEWTLFKNCKNLVKSQHEFLDFMIGFQLPLVAMVLLVVVTMSMVLNFKSFNFLAACLESNAGICFSQQLGEGRRLTNCKESSF